MPVLGLYTLHSNWEDGQYAVSIIINNLEYCIHSRDEIRLQFGGTAEQVSWDLGLKWFLAKIILTKIFCWICLWEQGGHWVDGSGLLC